MEPSSNRFKLRISNMFRSSFGSCKSKNINDVALVENPSQHHQLIELLSPKKPIRPFPPICKETPQTEETYIIKKSLLPRSKISEQTDLLVSETNFNGKKFPPISPLNSNYTFQESHTKFKEKKTKKPKSRKPRPRKKPNDFIDFPGFNYNGLFSSDEEEEKKQKEDEDDKTTLFSSRSLSSDSSESFRRRNQKRRGAKKQIQEKGGRTMPLQGRVKGSFAVVKRSSDPYNDFRTSMVEMIVEKQIFNSEDLERMLQCFLSLNSHHHHRIIIEVFMEIWEALFSSYS
ncbi:hypothetical protein Leryth_024580 [Lithospermum erythrorhizon]|nr:hypothetical protein Leryth_024580 [Lithospermum erythrorhizon]